MDKSPNNVLINHLGYVTANCCPIFYGDTVEDIEAWQASIPVPVIA